ncbi:MAG: tetratricopeptide repeat protein [Ginsengibacter sp.]
MFDNLQNESDGKNILQNTFVAGSVTQGDQFSFQRFDGTLHIDTLQFNNAEGTENIKVSLAAISTKLADKYEQQILLLQSQIADKELLIGSLTENKNQAKQLYQVEIDTLKDELSQKVTQAQEGKSQFNNFLSLLQNVDLNNASENYKSALDLFIAGKFEDAIDLLDDVKAEEDLKKVRELEEESNQVEKKLKEAKEEAAESKRKIAYEKSLKANFFGIKLDYEKAEYYHKEAIKILSDQLTNNLYGVFLLSQGRLKESIIYFEKAIELSESGISKAKNIALFALTLIDMNRLKDAEENINKAKEIVTTLHKDNNEPDTDTDVFIYVGLSVISSQKADISKAIAYAETALKLAENLPDDFENKETIKSICLGNLGVFYAANNQMEDAIDRTKMYLEISEDKFSRESKSPQNVAAIATSYNNLGKYYLLQKNLPGAEDNYKKGLSICMDFVEKYPSILSKLVALLSTNLGQLYVDSYADRLPDAISFFDKAIEYRDKSTGDDNESMKFNSSVAILYLARIYFFKNDLIQARKYFSACIYLINNLPEDSNLSYLVFKRNVFYYYGNFLFTNDQPEPAATYWQKSIEVFEKLFDEQPEAIAIVLVESVLNVGNSYTDLVKDPAKAIELYKRAFAIDCSYRKVFPEPDVTIVIKAYAQLFEFYDNASEYEELEKVVNRIEEILDAYPDLKQNYLTALAISKRTIGHNYQVSEQHDYNKALQYYLKAYELDPHDYLNLLLIGDCYRLFTPPDYENAFKYYSIAFDTNDHDVNLLGALTMCLVNLPGVAFEICEKICLKHIEVEPKNILPYVVMGDRFVSGDTPDFANAFSYYYKAFEIDNNNMAVLKVLLECIEKLPDAAIEKSEKVYGKYIELDPENIWPHLIMGDWFLNNKPANYTNAFRYYYRAYEIDDNKVELLEALFNCARNLGETDVEKLNKLYSRFRELQPGSVLADIVMGNFYENTIQPDFEKALDHYEKAYAIDPMDKTVLYELGRYYLNIPEPDYVESCKYLQEYAKQDPDNGQVNFWLGWDNLVLGNYESSKSYFENSSPENAAEVYQNLGHIAVIQKDAIKTMELYKKSIGLFNDKAKFYNSSMQDFKYLQKAGVDKDYFISTLEEALKE